MGCQVLKDKSESSWILTTVDIGGWCGCWPLYVHLRLCWQVCTLDYLMHEFWDATLFRWPVQAIPLNAKCQFLRSQPRSDHPVLSWSVVMPSYRPTSHENHTDSAALVLVRQIALVDASTDGGRSPVVEVVVELSVTGAELQLLEEEWIVLQGQSVEDIEVGLEVMSVKKQCSKQIGHLTFFASIRVSVISSCNLSLRPFSFSLNATSVA